MKKGLIIGTIFALVGMIGITYAWFSATLIGNEEAKDIITQTGTLSLLYTDSLEVKSINAKPGDFVTKKFTVKNTGTLSASYQIDWINLINTIKAGELRLSLACVSKDNNGNISGTCESIDNKMIPYTEEQRSDYKIKNNIDIEPNITHEYTLVIEFVEKDKNQNYNQGKSFSGVINIEEAIQKPVNNCIYDGQLVQGAEYTNGQYTYRYMQESNYDAYDEQYKWSNIETNGWGVMLTDKTSTSPVTTPLCTTINDKPIVSMTYMFHKSKAPSIDLSSFDTSSVTNMNSMFMQVQTSQLDLSSFDTSNVTSMSWMFLGCNATSIDLSSFDTNSVIDMKWMFNESNVSTLDLGNFDTSNVTKMSQMFYGIKVDNLNLSSFDTKKVTDMVGMFYNSQVETLDLSGFDTSSATEMLIMFANCSARKIYVGDCWNTSLVQNGYPMFMNNTNLVGESGTAFNSSNPTDKTYAHIDGGIENPGYFTYKTN